MKPIVTGQAPQAIGPYSQGMRVGNLVFFSGQIALDPATSSMVGDTIEAQTERVLLNIKALLDSCNTSFSNVCKTTVFLKDLGDFARFNEVYARYLSRPYPARSTVEVARLPKEALIEIEVIAVLPE